MSCFCRRCSLPVSSLSSWIRFGFACCCFRCHRRSLWSFAIGFRLVLPLLWVVDLVVIIVDSPWFCFVVVVVVIVVVVAMVPVFSLSVVFFAVLLVSGYRTPSVSF